MAWLNSIWTKRWFLLRRTINSKKCKSSLVIISLIALGLCAFRCIWTCMPHETGTVSVHVLHWTPDLYKIFNYECKPSLLPVAAVLVRESCWPKLFVTTSLRFHSVFHLFGNAPSDTGVLISYCFHPLFQPLVSMPPLSCVCHPCPSMYMGYLKL